MLKKIRESRSKSFDLPAKIFSFYSSKQNKATYQLYKPSLLKFQFILNINYKVLFLKQQYPIRNIATPVRVIPGTKYRKWLVSFISLCPLVGRRGILVFKPGLQGCFYKGIQRPRDLLLNRVQYWESCEAVSNNNIQTISTFIYMKNHTPILVPPEHPSQYLFEPYNKVRNYVEHLNAVYFQNMKNSKTFDRVSYRQWNLTPKENSQLKTSFYPKVCLSDQLRSRMDRIRRFQNLKKIKTSKSRLLKRKTVPSLVKYRSKKEILGMKYHNIMYQLERKERQTPDIFLSQFPIATLR